MGINNFVGVGRLTRDLDLRYTGTGTGTAVANGTIAVNRPFKNQAGEQEADFVNIVIWRKAAENAANFTKKGDRIGVVGRLQSRTYDDKDGKTIYVTEVVAESVQFLESRTSNNKQEHTNNNNANNNTSYENKQQQPSQSQSDTSQGEPIDIQDSDLPFWPELTNIKGGFND